MEKRWFGFRERWGAWSNRREFVRGGFHCSIGLANWILIQFVGLSLQMIGILLILIGATIFLLDRFRVYINMTRCLQESFLGRISRWTSRYITRESEQQETSSMCLAFFDLLLAWMLCVWVNCLWIAVGVGFVFSFLDPFAKLGKRWPLGYRFSKGMAKSKSLGGLVWGFLAGAFSCGVIILLEFITPSFSLIPSFVPIWFVILVYLAGIVTASGLELIGGKMDNFLIPAGSALVMTGLYSVFV